MPDEQKQPQPPRKDFSVTVPTARMGAKSPGASPPKKHEEQSAAGADNPPAKE